MHHSSLTLNQDKRRRFDSYPGSIIAGQRLADLGGGVGSGGECAQRGALAVEKRSTLADLEAVLNAEPCPSCEAGYTYPGMGRHRCYTAAEQAEWAAPARRRQRDVVLRIPSALAVEAVTS